jgi:hypothetical protein
MYICAETKMYMYMHGCTTTMKCPVSIIISIFRRFFDKLGHIMVVFSIFSVPNSAIIFARSFLYPHIGTSAHIPHPMASPPTTQPPTTNKPRRM